MLDDKHPLKLCRNIAELMMVSEDPAYPCVDLGIGYFTSIFSFVAEETIRWSNPKHGNCVATYQMLVGFDNFELNSEASSAVFQGSMPQNSSVVLSLRTSDQFKESLKILRPGFSGTTTVILRGPLALANSPEFLERFMKTTFEMLSQLPSLEVLHIAGNLTGQHAIARGLGIFNTSDGVDTTEPIFPKLQSLYVQGLVFDHDSHNPDSIWPVTYSPGPALLAKVSPLYVISQAPPSHTIPYKAFVSVVRSIKTAGAPALQHISFKSCYRVEDSFIKDLEKMGMLVERDIHSKRRFPPY
jgi:hypothetical protein